MPVTSKPIITTINVVQKNKLIITNIQHQSNIESHNLELEDPFENAAKENAKLKSKFDEKCLMLKSFESKLKKRLKEYRTLNNQLEENHHLKIEKSNDLKQLGNIKKKLANLSSKPIVVTNDDTKSNYHSSHKKTDFKLHRSVSVSSLPCFLSQSLKDDDVKFKNESKKRIVSTRKIYSNIERELVRKKHYKNKQLDMIKAKQVESVENMQMIKVNILKESFKPDSLPKLVVQIPSQNIDRYINYLKQLLKDKAKQNKLDIPLLCQCNSFNNEINGINLWDSDWNTCANNCLFYNNPKEYAKVLINMVNN